MTTDPYQWQRDHYEQVEKKNLQQTVNLLALNLDEFKARIGHDIGELKARLKAIEDHEGGK